MKKILTIVIVLILTSFYYFPVSLFGITITNTKMSMAVVGLLILGYKLSTNGQSKIDKDFFVLSGLALFVSLAGYLAVTYNETYDYTYVSYIMSMWVWMGGAYCLVSAMKFFTGSVSIEKICNYVIAMSVCQCILAILISRSPFVYNVVQILDPGISNVSSFKDGRLFGLGCAFDVAGIRFSAVLGMISYYLYKQFEQNEVNKVKVIGYILSFLIISVVGNMIARTTTMGIILFFSYLLFQVIRNYSNRKANGLLFKWLFAFLVLEIPIIIYLYNNDVEFHKDLRFAFEGFFSLWEEGEWNVRSNDILVTMYRFPETLKTWLVGDGYIESAENDPYYVGKLYLGYYMGTDVGYLRFIYYFGLIGLTAFVAFMCKATQVCMRRFEHDKWLFVLIWVVNFVCWFKVATDIFSVFAMFLVLSKKDDEEYRQMKELEKNGAENGAENAETTLSMD